MYLPIYRADYSIIWKYSFEELSLKTCIPATVFYSETDTPRSEMKLWKKYFTGECEFFQYEGTHFFIQDHHAEMADVIKNAWEIE
jgi:surfactin synthase thioesterase subunit